MCARAKGCAREPKDARARQSDVRASQRMCARAKGYAREPKDARASQRMRALARAMRALAKGCARSPSGLGTAPSSVQARRLANGLTVGPVRANHRRSGHRFGRAGSPSDAFAERQRSALAVGPAHANDGGADANHGRAASPSGVQLRRRACSFAVGRSGAPLSVPARASFPPAPRRAWRLGSGARMLTRGQPGSRLGERTRICASGFNFARPGSKRDERA
jgi:hypothetical protein